MKLVKYKTRNRFNQSFILIELSFFCFFLVFCKKGWLEAKPNKSLIIPSTIDDFQALLDNSSIFNSNQPVLGEVSADNYYVQYEKWQAIPTATERNAYIWESDIYDGETTTDWSAPYQKIFYSNVVLEGMVKISKDQYNMVSWDNIEGSALFWRAFNHYSLAQQFCKPYISETANSDLGIPLRMTADVNAKSVRSTIQETYSQILDDLNKAKDLLPPTPLYKTRPSKPAAFALLARTYLMMDKYDSAYAYSDSCLKLYNTLINYNTLDSTAGYPISQFNDEDILFVSCPFSRILFSLQNLIVDSTLYNSFDSRDLRKTMFFTTKTFGITFRGSYRGAFVLYGGIAIDEIYLTRAECAARIGNTDAAMSDLNILLQNRWRDGLFSPFVASNPDKALAIILAERRKELIFRGIRWSDLRRLNNDSRFSTTLVRVLDGKNYSLAPNSPLYVLPIPNNEITNSGIQQNPR